jgi:hypothetical protein
MRTKNPNGRTGQTSGLCACQCTGFCPHYEKSKKLKSLWPPTNQTLCFICSRSADPVLTAASVRGVAINNATSHATISRYLVLPKKSGCRAYDCEYIALAQDLARPLITTDKKLFRNSPHIWQINKTFVNVSA